MPYYTRKSPTHLASLPRHNQPTIIFLTVSTKHRRPILANARVHAALRSAWENAIHWHVGRYMIMPDHIHLFCSPAILDAEPVSVWAGFWKRTVSRALPELHTLWHSGSWDTQLRHARHYEERWAYVSRNPIRHGLVTTAEAWPHQGTMNELRW